MTEPSIEPIQKKIRVDYRKKKNEDNLEKREKGRLILLSLREIVLSRKKERYTSRKTTKVLVNDDSNESKN